MPSVSCQTQLSGPVTAIATAASFALQKRRRNFHPTPPALPSAAPPFSPVMNDTFRGGALPLSPDANASRERASRNTAAPMEDSSHFGNSGARGDLLELMPTHPLHVAEQLLDTICDSKSATTVDRRKVADLIASLLLRSEHFNGPLSSCAQPYSLGLPAVPDNGASITTPMVSSAVPNLSLPDIRIAQLQRQDSVMSLHATFVMPKRTDRAEMSVEGFDGTFTLNQYVMLQSIGHGAQGEVFLSVDMDKNEMRAIKMINRSNGQRHADPRSPLELARANRAAQHEREIEVMKRCRHRNIVSLYEVIDDPSSDKLYLVMQYIEHGSLVTLQPDGTASQVVKPELLAQYTRQLCAGLQYLHSHGIVHRDIKPDNILLGADDTVYLSDFGVSDVFEASAHASPVTGTRGTSAFLPPELVDPESSHETPTVDGKAVDIWALGVTLYVMLYGKLPWPKTNSTFDYWRLIAEVPIEFPPPDASHTGADEPWRALLQAMLQKDPRKRCTAEKARRLAKAVQESYSVSLTHPDTLLPLVWSSAAAHGYRNHMTSDASSESLAYSGRGQEGSTTTHAMSTATTDGRYSSLVSQAGQSD